MQISCQKHFLQNALWIKDFSYILRYLYAVGLSAVNLKNLRESARQAKNGELYKEGQRCS